MRRANGVDAGLCLDRPEGTTCRQFFIRGDDDKALAQFVMRIDQRRLFPGTHGLLRGEDKQRASPYGCCYASSLARDAEQTASSDGKLGYL